MPLLSSDLKHLTSDIIRQEVRRLDNSGGRGRGMVEDAQYDRDGSRDMQQSVLVLLNMIEQSLQSIPVGCDKLAGALQLRSSAIITLGHFIQSSLITDTHGHGHGHFQTDHLKTILKLCSRSSCPDLFWDAGDTGKASDASNVVEEHIQWCIDALLHCQDAELTCEWLEWVAGSMRVKSSSSSRGSVIYDVVRTSAPVREGLIRLGSMRRCFSSPAFFERLLNIVFMSFMSDSPQKKKEKGEGGSHGSTWHSNNELAVDVLRFWKSKPWQELSQCWRRQFLHALWNDFSGGISRSDCRLPMLATLSFVRDCEIIVKGPEEAAAKAKALLAVSTLLAGSSKGNNTNKAPEQKKKTRRRRSSSTSSSASQTGVRRSKRRKRK